MERRHRLADYVVPIVGLALVTVGGWYLLRNTIGLDMPEINKEAVWPIAVLGLGILILWNSLRDRPRSE